MSYADDLKIDRNDLISDWEEQAVLMMKYCDLYASSIFERDADKVKLDYISAKLDSDIRKNYKTYGFSAKPTETAVKNTIIMQKEYEKAAQNLLNSTKEANLMAGVRSSFEHRKKALENLVTLLVTGFHSEPKNKTENIKKLQEKTITENHDRNKKKLKGGKRNNLINKNLKK